MKNLVLFRPEGFALHWRSIAAGCMALSASGLVISLVLACMPGSNESYLSAVLLRVMPVAATLLGLVAGAVLLKSHRTQTPPPAGTAAMNEPSTVLVSGLQAVVQELGGVLVEQREKVTALQDLCSAGMREVRVVSARVAGLTEAALEAENRLGASVASAEERLRQPVAVNELADAVKRGMAEQSKVMAAGLDTMVGRLAVAADGPVQAFQAAVTAASGEMAALGDTAAVLRRDVMALNTAGREIAVASATVVSQLGGAVGQFDAVLAHLPVAASTVSSAAEQAALTLAKATGALNADGAALEAIGRETRQAAMAAQQAADALTAGARDMEAAGLQAIARIGSKVADANVVLGEIPGAAATIATAASQAAQVMSAAVTDLRTDRADLMAVGRDVQQATIELQRETAGLKAATDAISDAGFQAVGRVANATEMAVIDLGAMLTEAHTNRPDIERLSSLSAMLETAAAAVVDNMVTLDAAGQRVAAAGEQAAGLISTEVARGKHVMQALPGVAAGITAAADDVRREAAGLATTARQVSAAGGAAAAAVTNVAARAEVSVASLDTAGRSVSAASEAVTSQIEQLARIARQAETQSSLLPDVAGHITAAATWLQAVVETAPPAAVLALLPDVVVRLEAAAAGLDRIDAMAARLEGFAAEQPADAVREQARISMLDLSAQIGQSVRRVEAALSRHDGAWPMLTASLVQVQTAAVANDRMKPAEEGAPAGLTDAGRRVPAALAATLQGIDEVGCRTEMLLRQTEALAEAMLAGDTPELPPLLADHRSALLADIEVATQRLRAVASALSMGGEGGSGLEERLA